MPQTLALALIAGLFSLSVAIVGLIGIIIKTAADFRQGKRAADTAQVAVGVQQQVVGVQQQTVDVARIEKLVKETEDLRAEIRQLWDANRLIRHDFEMAEVQHEAEKKPLRQKCEDLDARCAAQAQTIEQQAERIARAEAERDIALAAQERAEGGLASAQKTIESLCPSSS